MFFSRKPYYIFLVENGGYFLNLVVILYLHWYDILTKIVLDYRIISLVSFVPVCS